MGTNFRLVHIAFLSQTGSQMYESQCSAVTVPMTGCTEYDAAFNFSSSLYVRTQAPIMLQCCSVLYSEGLAPKNPMLPSGGTLDNVTKTIGRLLDGYDIRLRPNFGGESKPILTRASQIFYFLVQVIHSMWVLT